MGRSRLVLFLIAIFIVNTTQASVPAWNDGNGNTMPAWVQVQPRDRQLLSLMVRDMHVDIVVAKDGSGNYTTITGAVDAARPVRDAKGKMFMARDLTVENTAGKDAGAAVALRSDSKYSVFYRCEFKGYEDTVLADSNRQFYRECVISGTVDFIYGNAKAVFQSCLLLARAPTSGKHNVITAQGRNGPDGSSGFSFQNCRVTSHEDLSGAETYLGRPWRNHSHVVFMQSFLDGIVHRSGWVPWNKADGGVPPTVYYGEYGNTGPGASLSARVPWVHVMGASEAAHYTVQGFIRGNEWLKATGVAYQPGL